MFLLTGKTLLFSFDTCISYVKSIFFRPLDKGKLQKYQTNLFNTMSYDISMTQYLYLVLRNNHLYQF